MFIEPKELTSVIQAHQLEYITDDGVVIQQAILAAISEATSYLNGKYDCAAIFNAQGDKRNVLVLEHCKSMAVWYLVRLSNADMMYDRIKDYYKIAIDWFKQVAGVGESGKTIAPDLPLKKSESGDAITKARFGSKRKFIHDFDD